MGILGRIEDKLFDEIYTRTQKLKRWQKIAVFVAAGLAVLGYYFVPSMLEKWKNRDAPFPKDVAGILVLRIDGDTADNSPQRHLTSEISTVLVQTVSKQRMASTVRTTLAMKS